MTQFIMEIKNILLSIILGIFFYYIDLGWYPRLLVFLMYSISLIGYGIEYQKRRQISTDKWKMERGL